MLPIKTISAYQKTKPVHDAYLKAADQDGFFRGHESNLIIYDAAVQTLQADGQSVSLPNIRKLQAEYGQLSKQKDKLYTAYGKLKKKVKQYEDIRQNVDGILKRENPSIQKDVDI